MGWLWIIGMVIVGLVFFPAYLAITFFLLLQGAVLLFIVVLIAGPGGIPKYSEIQEEDGRVIYNVDGVLIPLKPEPKPFFQRLLDMDGIHGGWDDRGRGADG